MNAVDKNNRQLTDDILENYNLTKM